MDSLKAETPEDLPYYDIVSPTLNVRELTFYLQRWNAYIESHPRLNSAEDLDDLNSLIMELVIQKRLLKAGKSQRSKFDSEAYSRSVRRYQMLKKSLRFERSARGTEGDADTLADLAARADSDKRDKAMREMEEEDVELEEKLKGLD